MALSEQKKDVAMSPKNQGKKRGAKRGLGRGLDALFQDGEASHYDDFVNKVEGDKALSKDGKIINKPEAISKKTIKEVLISNLSPGKYQPRSFFSDEKLEQLTASIKAHGILQPLFVRPSGNNKYEIVAGERRWRAAQQAQLHTVPVVVKDISDKEALEVALIENLQRHDLNPLEEAEGYKRLFDEFDYKQEDLATHLGKSRSHVANMMRLLKLPQLVQDFVREEKISAGHARALLSAKDVENTAKLVIKNGFSVRETEKYIQKQQSPDKKAVRKQSKIVKKGVDVIALEKEMTSLLGMSVSINAIDDNPQHGQITIKYNNLDQLDAVLAKLSV